MREGSGSSSRRISNLFDAELDERRCDSGQVTAWPAEAIDETDFDGIISGRKYDRDRLGCSFCGLRRNGATGGYQDHDRLPYELGCEHWELIILPVRPTVFHPYIASLDKPELG